MSDSKMTLNKEKAERRHECAALESRMENKIISVRKKLEEELNGIKEDIKSVRTGSGGTPSSAARTGYGLGSGHSPNHHPLRPSGKVSGPAKILRSQGE